MSGGNESARHCPSCRCPALGDEPTQQSATQRVNEGIAIIADLVEHANPIGQDADGFVATGYTVTVGAVHRAKGWLQGALPNALIDKVISNTHQCGVPRPPVDTSTASPESSLVLRDVGQQGLDPREGHAVDTVQHRGDPVVRD